MLGEASVDSSRLLATLWSNLPCAFKASWRMNCRRGTMKPISSTRPVAGKSGQKPQTGRNPCGYLTILHAGSFPGHRDREFLLYRGHSEHPSVATSQPSYPVFFFHFSGLVSQPECLQVEVFLHCTHTHVPLCTLHSWYVHTWAAGPDALKHTYLLTACTGK